MQTQIQNIINSFNFLREVCNRRLQVFFSKENIAAFTLPEIKIEPDDAPLNHFLRTYQLNIEEYIILMLGLMPHVQANLLDNVVQQYLPSGGEFPEIGGVKGTQLRSTFPTGETALFIIAGNDIAKKIQASNYFSPDHFFAKQDILHLQQTDYAEPRMSGRIILQPDYVDLFTTGNITRPVFGPEFPAKYITTKMDWADLVLNPKTSQQVQDIKVWLDYNPAFMKDWGMEKKIKPGYRALFYGPSGTGKTLTATLLGKQFQRDVYRIDLSQVVSKYIGETEKNLEKIFSKAENKNWILFFDEADALFGKRSNVQGAHDKYANQEVSYLLQRVEDFPGLVILASNLKTNIDQAFLRRFNSVIQFPLPTAAERCQIWKTSIPGIAKLANDTDVHWLAEKYELSGAAIIQVVHYASLQAISRGDNTLRKEDLIEAVRREYEKEEKVFSM
ncbi:MAG: ATP-binding protein [Chitinophagaceae bacterium]